MDLKFLRNADLTILFKFMTSSLFHFPRKFIVRHVSINITEFKNGKSTQTVNKIANKMPKHTRQRELRETRIQKQKGIKKWQNSIPAVTYLQVMGSGYGGSPRSLHVFTDHRKYLFNCGEGTQRMAHEHKIKLAKLEHVFVTYNSWENIGGLPGLTLTVQDIGVPRIQLHGPPGTEKLYQMTKGFLVTKHTDIEKHEYWENTFEDGALTIRYVPLFGSRKTFPHPTENLSPCKAENVNSEKNKKRSLSPSRVTEENSNHKKMKVSEDRENFDISLAYICKLHNKAGELNLEKCLNFGVPNGPLLGKLKDGYDVTLSNGSVVKSVDVVSPEEVGPTFIVIECPSEAFLDSLLAAKEFQSHQHFAASESALAQLVVHFTPARIMQHPKYKQWMSRFDPKTEHLVINEKFSGVSSSAVSRIQHKLHLLHSEIFPLLEYEKEISSPVQDNKSAETIIQAEPLLQYFLRPNRRFQRNTVVAIYPDAYRKEITEIPECVEKLNELKAILSAKEVNSEKYPEIVFLGTGSSIPSKARNVSAIIVTLSSESHVLLDCGEGTYDQILKLYGSNATQEFLQNLKAIYVSHVHADHHLGLIRILLERRKAFENRCDRSFRPFTLLAPQLFKSWLISYHNSFQPVLDDFILITNDWFQNHSEVSSIENYEKLLGETGLTKVVTTKVLHCKDSYGISFTLPDERKIVYSGDTMPSENLVEIGKGCDILIHEATMEDELVKEARTKMHSTTSEAIEIGKKMEAKFTILTHFSQRYAKIPLFNDNFHNTVGVAFDNMKLSWNNLHLIPLFIPALKLMFSEDYETMEELRDKKLRRQIAAESENQTSASDIKL